MTLGLGQRELGGVRRAVEEEAGVKLIQGRVHINRGGVGLFNGQVQIARRAQVDLQPGGERFITSVDGAHLIILGRRQGYG